MLKIYLLVTNKFSAIFAVLDRVKDFLGVMKEANRRLELGAKVCG